MIPIKDDNPTLSAPVVTWALIAANAIAWVLVQGMGASPALERSVCTLGLIPGEFLHNVPAGTRVMLGPNDLCELGTGPSWYTPVTSMFMHGGWMHIIGNMWFLHIFGNNVEDSMGHVRFVLFYLLCGVAAAMTQAFLDPDGTIPMVGASGAIGGVMGAYVVLYPRVQIHMLVPIFVILTRIVVPAYFMLGYWFLIQIVSGWASFGESGGGTAFWAHVGGFLAGVLLIYVFRDRQLVAAHRAGAHNWRRGQFREPSY